MFCFVSDSLSLCGKEIHHTIRYPPSNSLGEWCPKFFSTCVTNMSRDLYSELKYYGQNKHHRKKSLYPNCSDFSIHNQLLS